MHDLWIYLVQFMIFGIGVAAMHRNSAWLRKKLALCKIFVTSHLSLRTPSNSPTVAKIQTGTRPKMFAPTFKPY